MPFLSAFVPLQVDAASPSSSGPADERLGWALPSGRGVGLGGDFFAVASPETNIALDLSIVVPFSSLFALRMRATLFDANGAPGGLSVGDKLEVMFRSAVLMNFVRVYAGGGPAMFYGVSGSIAGQVDGNWFAGDINGNWFTGAEIFVDSRSAVHWEVGTSGGAFGGAGPYFDVGLTVYPFSSTSK